MQIFFYFQYVRNISKNARIAGSWVNCNQISTYIDERLSNKIVERYNSTVHVLGPEVILYSPQLRKLVNESNGVFLSIQKLKSSSGDIRPELLKHSKQYRSILRACIENLQDISGKSLPDNRESLENFLTIFYQIECIWHLTEILYVDVVPGKSFCSNCIFKYRGWSGQNLAWYLDTR